MTLIKSGDKVDVKINIEGEVVENSRQVADSREQSAGIIPLETSRKYLPRRISQIKLLNFYDVSLVKTGAGTVFADENFSIIKPIRQGYSDIEMPGADDFKVYQNLLLSRAPLGEWKNKYKRIEKKDVNFYDLALEINGAAETVFTDENENWSDKGLKAENITRLGLKNFGAFYYFDTNLTSLFKVTEVPDYTAAAVELNLTKGGDVFLLPPLVRHYMTGTPTGTTDRQYVLDDFYRSFRRSHYKEIGFFRRDTELDSPPVFTTPAAVNDFIAYLKTLPNARCNSFDPHGVWQAETLDAFPLAGSSESVLIAGSANGYPSYAGVLIVVIKSGGGNFYIWLKSSNAAYKSQIFRSP